MNGIRIALVLVAVLSSRCVASAAPPPVGIAIGSQYDSFHVYVDPADFDKLTSSLVATFGGSETKKSETTVTPTASETYNAAVVTPVGLFSVFGFETPIPYPFGIERTGYLVADIDEAVSKARSSGADVVVSPFPDPIGKDAVVRWPGAVGMQFYWHTVPPHAPPLATVPENRVYISPDSANAFIRGFLEFSGGRVAADDSASPGSELGLPIGHTFRRVRIESAFGTVVAFVVDAKLPWPYGREQAGIGVSSVSETVKKATAAGATVVVAPFSTEGRISTMLQFPGGYVVEAHGAP
jgi:predicted enzyme related to lactoylglutathione lyase